MELNWKKESEIFYSTELKPGYLECMWVEDFKQWQIHYWDSYVDEFVDLYLCKEEVDRALIETEIWVIDFMLGLVNNYSEVLGLEVW